MERIQVCKEMVRHKRKRTKKNGKVLLYGRFSEGSFCNSRWDYYMAKFHWEKMDRGKASNDYTTPADFLIDLVCLNNIGLGLSWLTLLL